jgi:hypothetical protein
MRARMAAPIMRVLRYEERIRVPIKKRLLFGPYVQGSFVPGSIQMRVKD